MNVELNTFYQHVDGGLYLTKSISSSTVDQSLWVIYDHVWPFEMKQWHRPIEEWTPERFTKIGYAEATEIALGDKEQAQKLIGERKAARRAAQGK